MAPPIQLDPSSVEAIAQLKCSNEDNSAAQRILHINNGLVYIWSNKDSTILTLCCTTKERYNLIPTDTPMFDVDQLQVSSSGRWACLSGPNGITIVELPRRLGRQGKFIGSDSEDSEIICRSFSLAQKFFVAHPKVVVQKVIWHPGSIYDNYVTVLTSDNSLRIFNLDDRENIGAHAEQTINLTPTRRDASKPKMFGESALTLPAAIGETAVDFAFAPPVTMSSDDDVYPLKNLWPIFLLHGNGNVFCVLTGLGSNATTVPDIMGPLPMNPDSEDNYGLDSCSIICLHPTISSPPILVIATNGGTIYHCIVMNQNQEEEDKDDDAKSQASDWSSSTFGRNIKDSKDPDLSIFVFESVELELALTSDDSKGGPRPTPFDYPILLYLDSSTPARYFCSHKAGIHSVGLPMVSQISEMMQNDETPMENLAEQPSIVEHLVCTQMSSGTPPGPILGLAVAFPPSSLVFLTTDYQIQMIELSSPYFIQPLPLITKDEVEGSVSPLRKDNCKESFEQRIAKMLQRSTTQPLMKGPSGTQMSNVECLKILSKSLQVLRVEYIDRLEKVRGELERKSEQLGNRKRQQQASLDKLSREKTILRENAAQLSERYEDIKDNTERISIRIQRVLHTIQSQQPGNSDAELRMQRHVKTLQQKLKNMENALEQIKSKEKYQFRQIWQSRQNVMHQRLTSSPGDKISDEQLSSIKTLLQQNGQEISEVVQDLNMAQNCLGLST